MCKYEGHKECEGICTGTSHKCKQYELFRSEERRNDPEKSRKAREYSHKHYHDNPEYAREVRYKWAQDNRDKYLNSQKKRDAKDIYFIKSTLKNHELKYDVQVTLEEALELYQSTKTCRYCGKEMKRGDRKGQMQGPSLDRIDNEHVLTKNNIQFICKTCNLTKSARTHDEFMAFMRRALELNP
jgi:hypothetical protein